MGDGITRIAVEGFKSIVNRQEIEIAPLTILAGANSSGKSSIMQPLLLLKQTLEQTFDPGPLWLGGPNVKFSSAAKIFSKGGPEPQSFRVRNDTESNEWHRVCFKRAGMGIDVAEVEFHLEGLHHGPLQLDMSQK